MPSLPLAGQFGPLAFEDPWWKVILIILAALLAAASLVYDYIYAGQDPNFVIGNITAKSNRSSSNVDAAIARLNGSRAIDLNVLEAQSDDRNNSLPINGSTGGTVAIDRSDNGDRGIQNAILGNVVFKSGARSATTRGLVSSISLNTNVDGISYTNQVLIAQLAAANNPMVLFNEHVLDGDIGETVHQPSPVGLDDSFEIGFQFDVCNPANFVRIDTPDTVGGSILAGAAAAVALAAALSDEIDPTREGQQATPPPDGAITQAEYTKVKLNYHQYPLPGTPLHLEAKWEYERRTNKGILTHADDPSRQNPHTLLYHRLFSDRKRYAPTDTIELFGVLIPSLEGRVSCKNYHCIALLRPNRIDKSYPIVLRSIQEYPNSSELRQQFFRLLEGQELTENEKELLKNQRRLCIYYGEFSAAGVSIQYHPVQTRSLLPKPLEVWRFPTITVPHSTLPAAHLCSRMMAVSISNCLV